MSIRYIVIALILCCHCNLVRSSHQSQDIYDNTVIGTWFDCFFTANASVSFQNNVIHLLSNFTQQSSVRSFYNTSIGDDNLDRVYGYYMCRGDVSLEVCNDCITNSTIYAGSCNYIDAMFITELCMFRYSDHSMYGLWEELITEVGSKGGIVSNYQEFNSRLLSTIGDLIEEATSTSHDNSSTLGFATLEANVTSDHTIYSLAQCTPDIVGVNCTDCLESSFSRLRQEADGAPSAFATNNKCVLRYDNAPFYHTHG